MQYLDAFWVGLATSIALLLLSGRVHALQRAMPTLGAFLYFARLSLLIVAVATDNPSSVLGPEFPASMQWLACTLAMAFGAWWYYFRPLKEKVHVLDLEFHSGLTEVRADIRHVDSDLQEFKQEMRRDMREVRRGVQTLLARSA